MFGLRYFQASPTTYVLQYRNGRPVREGAGRSFFYLSPGTTLVAVPLDSVDAPFMFSEVSGDFQEVTVQGQVTYRVSDPQRLAGLMDFSLARNSVYPVEAQNQLRMRVINAVQVQLRAVLQAMMLRQLLRSSDQVVQQVAEGLRGTETLAALGVELIGLAVLAIRPSPETARALEAPVRESLLKEADDATYLRRNAAIEQERAVRENELNTEIAVETKRRQIREAQVEADGAVLAKRQEIEDRTLTGDISIAGRSEELVTLQARNSGIEAEAKSRTVAQLVKAIEGVDPRVLQALMIGRHDPSAVIAAAFQDLAANAERIGELNVGPDLLRDLMRHAERHEPDGPSPSPSDDATATTSDRPRRRPATGRTG